MKTLFLLAAIISIHLMALTSTAATAPAGVTVAEWASLQQQLPPFVQEAYLKASNTGPFDFFGSSVAISGDTVVIGAPYEQSRASGVNADQDDNSGTKMGAVYVFVRSGTGWVQQAYLKASNTGNSDQFGRVVAVSGDTVVVGSHYESSKASGVNGDGSDNSVLASGAAYVFVRSGTTWTQEAYLKASNPDVNDYFGWSVAVSGNTVLVGAPGESSGATGVNGDQSDDSALRAGAAYVFVRDGTNWTQQAYLKASNTGGGIFGRLSGDEFGFSVALSDDTAVIGAVTESSGATGVNGDEDDNSAYQSGAAYVFVRGETGWSQQAYLKASNTGAGDYFGWSVAVSGDTVLVGAPHEASGATGVNGNQSDNSAFQAGAAYIFARDGSIWMQQAYLKASNTGGGVPGVLGGDSFGESVSLSGDTAVVGATWESSNATGINGNGSDNSASNSGAAYVFISNGMNWSQSAYLKSSNSEGPAPGEFYGDNFGVGVGVSGETLIIGARYESSSATGVNGNQNDNFARYSGAAYVFAAIPPDADGDGVSDGEDSCPGTPAGAVTDSNGCSIAQLVPCDGPWSSHGEYVRTLSIVTAHFVEAGLITEEQRRQIVRAGRISDCGKKLKP
jgi:hypothetical protein